MGLKDEDDYDEIAEEKGKLAAIKEVVSDGASEIDDELGASEAYENKKEIRERKKEDNPVSVTCRACQSELDSADVERCRHCGYDASGHFMWGAIHAAIIIPAAITIIGIPIAIIAFQKMRMHRRKKTEGVAKKHWE